MDTELSLDALERRIGTEPTNAQLRYLYGAELAQQRLYERALIEFGTALHLAPDMHYARFQLGLLQLSMAQPAAALSSWSALDTLRGEFMHLALFKRGLEALIHDQFDDCIDRLSEGIRINTHNPALNKDMTLIIQRVRAQKEPKATASQPAGSPTATSTPDEVRTDFSKYTDSGSLH